MISWFAILWYMINITVHGSEGGTLCRKGFIYKGVLEKLRINCRNKEIYWNWRPTLGHKKHLYGNIVCLTGSYVKNHQNNQWINEDYPSERILLHGAQTGLSMGLQDLFAKPCRDRSDRTSGLRCCVQNQVSLHFWARLPLCQVHSHRDSSLWSQDGNCQPLAHVATAFLLYINRREERAFF